MLSIKGREPYLRMEMWLNDPNNISKLKVVRTDDHPQTIYGAAELGEDNRSPKQPALPCNSASLTPSPLSTRNPSATEDSITEEHKGEVSKPNKRFRVEDDEALSDNEITSVPSAEKKQRMEGDLCEEKEDVTDDQKMTLLKAFSSESSPPNTMIMEYLSNHLKLDATTLSNWFLSQRLLMKRHASLTPPDSIIPPQANREKDISISEK